ncbi:MAG TPA: hypothetical protein VMY78_16585 [Solirubrobacteraceae bacterium]|nr:hypothetical protein [Solirubrobacteraceae bacterium]
MGEVTVNVPAYAGDSNRWGDWVILRQPPQETVVLNLEQLTFADPLFVLRLRGFIDWHCSNGHEVRVIRPRASRVRLYLARMGVARELPEGCECDLGAVPEVERSDVLIPIRRLVSNLDGDALDDELGALYDGARGQCRAVLGRSRTSRGGLYEDSERDVQSGPDS